MSSTYQYEELLAGKRLRLLRLLPGSYDDQIHLELFTVELERAPPYEAVSYCWGDPSDQEKIICCGQAMYITRSLYSGMKRFRWPDEERILWADAVCIDQLNNKEKGHQVNMMADVYDHSTAVLVWLGEATSITAEKAFRLIRKINEYVESNVIESEISKDTWKAVANVLTSIDWSQVFQDDSESEALRDMFCQPWFYRLWVLQEVAVASSAWVLYGATAISLSDVVQTAVILTLRSGLHTEFPVSNLSAAFVNVFSTYAKKNTWIQEKLILQHSRNYIEREVVPPFHHILSIGRQFNTTKPHDYVYAFLGHPSARAKHGSLAILEADYTLSIEDVYRQLAERLYERDQRLEFLSAVSHQDPSSIEQSQSWAPKFHFADSDSSRYQRYWDADNSAVTEKFMRVDFQGSTLHCRTLIFDSISTFSETFEVDMLESTSPSPIEICWNLQAPFMPPNEVDKRFRHLKWTITGGSYPGGQGTFEQDFESYFMERISSEFCAHIRPDFIKSETSLSNGDWRRFHGQIFVHMYGRKFFITKDGRFGLGPSLLQNGDICCLLIGSNMPFILRATSTSSHFKLVGPSFIDGVMKGEIVDARVKSASDLTDITLV
jgi:Heterokaryon incompatibility protein (HET)